MQIIMLNISLSNFIFSAIVIYYSGVGKLFENTLWKFLNIYI